MKTTHIVKDGSQLTDEQEEILSRRYRDLKRRISEGTIDFDWAKSEIQRIQEGRNARIVHHWPMWTRIIAENGLKPTTEVVGTIQASGVAVMGDVMDLLGNEEFVKDEYPLELELVKVTMTDLGFVKPKKLVYLHEVKHRAIELGLLPCPNVAVVELCEKLSTVTDEWYPHTIVGEPLFVGVDKNVAAAFQIRVDDIKKTPYERQLSPVYYETGVADYEHLIFARSVRKADMRTFGEVFKKFLGKT